MRTLLGHGEWVMENCRVAVPEYEWPASTFHPAKFDARAWVELARAAGAGIRLGANTAGFNTTEIGTLPTETSLTINRSWGFDITDRSFKSVRALVGTLVRAAGTGTNLLLDVGPRPDGTIQGDGRR